MKRAPEDFYVVEQLPFDLSGEGEHQYVQVRKTGVNTVDVANALARQAGVSARQVGYSGLKDKHAVCEQWFSVALPGRGDVGFTPQPGVDILQVQRHARKLRIGSHRRNAFEIRLHDCTGPREAWDARLHTIARQGFPNYFGAQRFGRGFSNLTAAERLFASPKNRWPRHKRSLALSAARSWLFNAVCAERLQSGCWQMPPVNELWVLEGSRSFFRGEDAAADRARMDAGDIHPSGPLWGRRDAADDDDLAARERAWLMPYDAFCEGLASAGLKMERRALRSLAHDLQWRWTGEASLTLSFTLNTGCFATALLRELASCPEGLDA